MKIASSKEKTITKPSNAANKIDMALLRKVMMIICGALALLLYANTVTHDYTVDDGTVMQNNKIVKKGPSAIGEIFTTSYRKGFWDRNESLYRPLSVAMFAIEWGIAPENPMPGHIMNILLYCLTGVMLFLLLQLMFADRHPLIPFFMTLLFVAHPIHTEVVANIKSRDEILCFLFCVSGLYFLLKNISVNKIQNIVFAGLCFLFANLSKENALTMVVVAPLTVWFFSNASRNQLLSALGAAGIAAAIYFAMRINAIGSVSNFNEIEIINNSLVGAKDDIGTRLASSFMIMGKYFLLLFFPHPLSFDYSYNTFPLVTFGNAKALLATLAIIALAVYVVMNFKKKDSIAFGIIFFALTISLVSNVAFLIEATMAERFAYMPSLGFCIAIILLLTKYMQPNIGKNTTSLMGLLKDNNKLTLVMIVVLSLFSIKTISRNMDWEYNLKLLAKDVQTCPESARIHYAYGSALIIEKGLKEETDIPAKNKYLQDGIEQLQKGVELVPTYNDAWYHMAIAYKELKDNPNALRCFEKARNEKYSKDAEFLVAQGVSMGEAKMFDKAFENFNAAIAINPKSSEAYNNMGIYLTDAGKLNEALVSLNKSVELKKDNENAVYNIGNVYRIAGDFRKAIEYYTKAIAMKPTYADAWNNTGNCYGMLKEYQKAMEAYKKLLELSPNNANATNNLGITYMLLGDSVTGRQYVEKARQMMGN